MKTGLVILLLSISLFANPFNAYADPESCCYMILMPLGVYGNYSILSEDANDSSFSWGLKTGGFISHHTEENAVGIECTFSNIKFKEKSDEDSLSIKNVNVNFLYRSKINEMCCSYVAGGPGYYVAEKGDNEDKSAGIHLGAGLLLQSGKKERRKTNPVTVDISGNYHHTFNGKDFFELRAGLNFDFTRWVEKNIN